MSSSPLVSVIITTYNRKKLLNRSIQSVLNQTYKNIELIVIDDNSSDGTDEFIKTYYPDIIYIKNKCNIDAQKSRNIAITKAKGEFIATLDDDDYWLPEKIEVQMNFIKNYDVVGCLHSFNYQPRLYFFVPNNKNEIIAKDIHQFLRSNKGFSPSKILCRKETIVKVKGYDHKVPGPEGIDLIIKILKNNGKIGYVNSILTVHNTNHGLGRITTSKRMIWGSIHELKKNYPYRTISENKLRKVQVYLLLFQYNRKVKWLLPIIFLLDRNNVFSILKAMRIRLIDQSFFGGIILNIYRRLKYV